MPTTFDANQYSGPLQDPAGFNSKYTCVFSSLASVDRTNSPVEIVVVKYSHKSGIRPVRSKYFYNARTAIFIVGLSSPGLHRMFLQSPDRTALVFTAALMLTAALVIPMPSSSTFTTTTAGDTTLPTRPTLMRPGGRPSHSLSHSYVIRECWDYFVLASPYPAVAL